MSNRINKNIPKFIIDMESEKRSKIFYPDYTPLPPVDKPMDSPKTSQTAPKTPAQPKPKRKESKSVSDSKKILTLWLNQKGPFLSQQKILDLHNITSGSIISKTKKDLEINGYIKTHKLQIGKTHSSIWEPTDKAYKLVGLTKPTWESKGGYLHQFIAHHLKINGIKDGYNVEIEYLLENSKAVDLLLRNDNEIIFIEIATSYPLDKEISNIIKDFSSNLIPDQFIIAAQNGKMKKQLEKLINNDNRIDSYRDKIKVVLSGNLITQGRINS
ncbi:MAG: hypothetical protein U9N54_11195 [candidate division Zixibacteria bacterium]|nr:hypothetical protein [candidate division Zixibacteria bacterium]